VKCSDKVEFWEEICRLPLKYVSAGARAAAFYAKYPAELADEMAVDFIQYVDCSTPPNADEDMHLSMLSSLVGSDTYYRGIKALLPAWPFDYRVCLRLREAILTEDMQVFDEALEAVRNELVVFATWLEATGQWEKRPNEPDREKHREHRRSHVRALRMCYVRDHTFLKWKGEGMTPATIRDRWNAENPDQAISLDNKESGRDVVIQGIKKAKLEGDKT
jgi:hypothetical protein